VQINRRQGEPITSPEPHTRIEPGDGVVLIGRVLGSRHMFESATAARPPGLIARGRRPPSDDHA
jgi:uncharacterized protein with PhoU and TrkA domain